MSTQKEGQQSVSTGPHSFIGGALGPAKTWEESALHEQLETLRQAVIGLTQQVREIRKELRAMRTHSHSADSRVMVPMDWMMDEPARTPIVPYALSRREDR